MSVNGYKFKCREVDQYYNVMRSREADQYEQEAARTRENVSLLEGQFCSFKLRGKQTCRLSTIAKTGIALILLAVLVSSGALTIHRTLGFHAMGEWIKNQAHGLNHGMTHSFHVLSAKALTNLDSGDFNLGEGLCSVAIGIGGGLMLTLIGIKGIKYIQYRLHHRQKKNEDKYGAWAPPHSLKESGQYQTKYVSFGHGTPPSSLRESFCES